MKKTMLAGLISLALTACAGTPFKWDSARQIKQGMTTEEVTKLMGAPYSVVSREGVIRYIWVDVGAFSGSKSVAVDFKDGRAVSAPPIPEEFK
ncbi:hypothetical protein [Chromobacterium haemolyticum]|uniref:hypothetical protein n=1 Tax=Chromobacterium haemolyticum TaxID=394935 RepID=UPI0013B3CD15|nr:hypothetical protein [Chromobacterium haemolyticum]